MDLSRLQSTDISGDQERIYVRDMVCRSRVQPFFSGARKNVAQERAAEIEPSGSIDWCTCYKSSILVMV